VRIARQPTAADFPAEVQHLLFSNAPFHERTRANARRAVAQDVQQVPAMLAAAGVVGMPEMIEKHVTGVMRVGAASGRMNRRQIWNGLSLCPFVATQKRLSDRHVRCPPVHNCCSSSPPTASCSKIDTKTLPPPFVRLLCQSGIDVNTAKRLAEGLHLAKSRLSRASPWSGWKKLGHRFEFRDRYITISRPWQEARNISPRTTLARLLRPSLCVSFNM
jgi:hypothetical protein